MAKGRVRLTSMSAPFLMPLRLAFSHAAAPRSLALGRWIALLCILGMSGVASADCGDWLAPRQVDHASSLAADYHQSAKFTSRLFAQSPRLPCKGPYCGRAPQVPPQPVSASVSPTVKVHGCSIGAKYQLRSAEMHVAFVDSPRCELAGYPLQVDRPPAI